MLKSRKINNNGIVYRLKKSRRAGRMRLTVHCDASVVVTLPIGANENVVEKFLRDKDGWIRSKILYFKNRSPRTILISGKRNYLKHKASALELAKSRVDHFNRYYNFQINKITVRDQKTRWGSCSRKRNLNFNYKLLFLPEKLADYLVVHELCHLKELNHQTSFWQLVAKTLPDFKDLRKELKNYSI